MPKPNIILIEPPAVSLFGNQRIFGGNGSNKSDFRKPPLDLMMISGYLRKSGFDNMLLDANASRKTIVDVKRNIEDQKPDVVLFSTSTCTIYKDLLIARIAKEVNPFALTVAIGTHVMALLEETLREAEHLDVVVYSSEWEQVSLNIVQNLSDLKEARGIYYKNATGQIGKTVNQPVLENLDDLGFPSHDKLDKELYRDPIIKRFPKTMVMGQKGCINNCSFCCQPAFFGAPRIRKRSVAHFIEELKWVQKLGFREVMFNDATLTADMDWALELFEEMIRNKIDLVWNCSTRAPSIINLNPDIVKLMKRAGCHTVMIGLESANETVLKNIRKNVTPEEVRVATDLARKAGMDVVVFAVIGFPGETKESILETISFLKSINTTYITFGIAVPVPGTDFYKYVEENGYLLTKEWSKYDPMKKPVFSYPGLSADDMAYYSAFGLRQFYLRPKYILKKLMSLKSLTETKSNFKNFKGFVRRYLLETVTKKS